MGSYPCPFGIKFFFSIHAKPHFFSRSRPIFDSRCEVCQQIFSEKHNFFFDHLKRLLVVQILEVIVYQENAEHIRLITFHWQSEKVEKGGTCLEEPKSIQQKVVFNSCKLCYYTEDTFTRNCVQGFSDIRRNEKVLL